MPSQVPSTKNANNIDLGNAVVYFAQGAFASFTAARSATTWRKLGLLKTGSTLNLEVETTSFSSGFPLREQKKFYTSVKGSVTGEMLEFSIENLADAMGIGRANITYTVKASAPAATTVVTGSTKTVVNVTSATGYVAGDKIRIGTGATAQIGVIKSIASNVFTLDEGLSLDITPTAGLAVAKIDTATITGGSIASPLDISLKLTKTHIGTGETYDYIIPKAQASGAFSLAFVDNTGTNDGVGIPFNYSLLSDPDVENGGIFQVAATQA
jgi:FtsP/CotA-like multicopper oxidase with cupredoxin domain